MRKFSVVPGLFAGLVLLSLPAVSLAGVFLSINIAPPVLQVYQQPLCPVDGYLWTPGYWGYGNAGYYWIPGAWLAPPQAGFLWTPGYWGFSGGLYSFNAGYWGPTVGFYGGVNYGFGYGGNGFDGGRWQGGHFAYNTAVSRVNTSVIHNTYVQNVSYGNNRASFNGAGGIGARPSSEQVAMARQHNQPAAVGPTQARQATENGGRPAAVPASANNRSAEPQNRMATRATPSAARPEQERQAAAPRAAPQQQTHAASPQPTRQVASNRSEAPSRPAPQQQRPQATHAAAPEHAAARPEGKEERR
jgi:WXXGXW repeat (2 copies)